MLPEIETVVYRLLDSLLEKPLTLTEYNRSNSNFQPKLRYDKAQNVIVTNKFAKVYLGTSLKGRPPWMIEITPKGEKERDRLLAMYSK